VRLVRDKKIPAYQLRHFTFWVGRARPTDRQVAEAIEILLPHVESGDTACAEVMMEFLSARVHTKAFEGFLETYAELVWGALEVFTDHPGHQTSDFWWGNILQQLASENHQAAIRLACKALVSNEFSMSDKAANLLALWSKQYPEEVMSNVGELMLDPMLSVRFFVAKFPFFNVLPVRVVTDWLLRAGSEGAQKNARHLPEPYVDVSGNPVVPELTAWVLANFEKDDRVFSEFCAGVHSYQTYTGDIVGAHEAESEIARKFSGHPLARIREWARIEYESARANAARFRAWEDEMTP